MWQKNVRYLDYNASSGITGSVRKKLTEILDRSDLYFANPSSLHRPGQQSRQLLLRSGMKIAESFGEKVEINQLVFTSSGTEANQTAIRSEIRFAEESGKTMIIIGAGEHSASHDLLATIPKSIPSAELPLLSNGQYDLEFLRELLANAKRSGCSKIFLSVFWANNETGVLTSLGELEEVLRSSGLECVLHLDAAQVWGKLALDLMASPAHFVTFSSHKIGAPAGGGFLWVRPGRLLHPLFPGTQAGGRRGGTENLLSIAAMAFAVEDLDPQAFSVNTSALRDRLEAGLKRFPVKIWGAESPRISNTSRFGFNGFQGYANWVELFDLRGFAVSHGSACKSNLIEPSRVLLKMGATESEALNAIRVSFGPHIQLSDVDDFLMVIEGILREKGVRS